MDIPIFRICLGISATILFAGLIIGWAMYWYSLAYPNRFSCSSGYFIADADGQLVCRKPK